MHYRQYKTILSPQHGMNLYRGCTHGCIYCDSRSVCYQMDHAFEDIEVKENAPVILENQLKRMRNKCMIKTGAMSDPYIHLEDTLKQTRACLEVIDRYGFGLSIQTKSERILNDLDVLKSIHQKAKCVVEMTLTTFDDQLCKIIEPNVSLTSERIEVLKKMKEEGIETVVWLSPILPFINDTEENLVGILDACIEHKVRGILCFGFSVTLREGNREHFYTKLDEHFPGIRRMYEQTFGSSYVCTSKNHTKLMHIFEETCKKHEILYRPEDVFAYLHKLETKNHQYSLFDV